jgi:hypothetical protein
LFKGRGTKPGGACPAGGKHQPLKTLNYVLYADPTDSNPSLSYSWCQCRLCAALFHYAFDDFGECPKNASGHLRGPTPDHALWSGAPVAGMMDDAWDECSKCKGLFNYAGGNIGVCQIAVGHARFGRNLSLFFLD